MIPARITLKALKNVAVSITIILIFFVSTPKAFASSSPKLRAFKYFDKNISNQYPSRKHTII